MVGKFGNGKHVIDRHVVIPTRFSRQTLAPLVEACRVVAEVVLVHTEPGHAPVFGVTNVRSSSLSIQRWWNTGLDLCHGPTLVLNDDIVASPEDLELLFDALDTADVVYLAGHRAGHATPLTGWCYGLRPDVIRPDDAFQWWAGDDDLYLRALRDGLTVTAVDVPDIVHHRGVEAFENPVHAAMVDADMRLLHDRFGSTVNVGGVVQFGV